MIILSSSKNLFSMRKKGYVLKMPISSGSWNALAADRIISSGTRIRIYPFLTSSLTAIPVYGRPFFSLNFDRNSLGFSLTPLALSRSR
jgi:hypothetical protein